MEAGENMNDGHPYHLDPMWHNQPKDPELDWTEEEKQIVFDVIRSTRSDTSYVWTPVDRCLLAKQQLPHKSLRDIAVRCSMLFEQDFRLYHCRKIIMDVFSGCLTQKLSQQVAPSHIAMNIRNVELFLDDMERRLSLHDYEVLHSLEHVEPMLHQCITMLKELPESDRMPELPLIIAPVAPFERYT